MRFSLVLTLALTACASKPFSQEVAPDGRTWTVNANEIACSEAAQCKAEVKRVITARGKLVCGAQPFRVISCDRKITNYGLAKAQCMLRCGEAPALSNPADEIDL